MSVERPGRELFALAVIIVYNLTATFEDVFVRSQPFESNGATTVQPTSANPDFGTQAIFETVGKSCRRVVANRRGINTAQENVGRLRIFGDNGIGVVAAEIVDVIDRFAQRTNDLHRRFPKPSE